MNILEMTDFEMGYLDFIEGLAELPEVITPEDVEYMQGWLKAQEIVKNKERS